MEASGWVSLLLLVGALMSSMPRCCAYDFYVGGRDGWVTNPSENFNKWAEKNRFQVHDRLVFKYKQGEDSVLVVKKEDYDSCNTNNPIRKLDDGDSVYMFDRSGPFFFISGVSDRCRKGEKLIVVVMAERNKKQSPTPSPSPPPPSLPASPSPSPSTSPSPSPSFPSPSRLAPEEAPSSEPPPSPPLSSSCPFSFSPVVLGVSLGLVAFVLSAAFF